jgi:hypothetical protein
LVGYFSPEELFWVVAAIEGSDAGACERQGGGHPCTVLLAERGVLSEQAEPDEQVGFAATHCLLEMKDRLRRCACQPGNTFADEVLHALRDKCFREEGRAIFLRANQLVELLDLIAEFDGERIVLKLAGVSYSFQSDVTLPTCCSVSLLESKIGFIPSFES